MAYNLAKDEPAEIRKDCINEKEKVFDYLNTPYATAYYN